MRIDWWTLGIQTVNVAVLVWLLGRFFWRPVAAMIEQRRAAAQLLLDEAEASRAKQASLLAEIERTRAGFAQEHAAVLAAAHEAGEQARAARLADAAREADSLLAGARAALAAEQKAAEAAWEARASQLAVNIAERLAGRLNGVAVRAAFLDWLVQEIRTLPEATRQAERIFDVVSASALPPAEQEQARAAIAAALGAAPAITFVTDPALIAGLELRGGQLVVSNSWRADLHSIVTELGSGDKK
jgi:F-type H+-transporting ATPase subunit b